MENSTDFLVVGIKLLGALGLLIFGMKMMSESLQKLAGPQLRHVLGRMTSNRVTGILTGAMVTAAVQSSSATTVMTVSFVSAGLLTLAQAISVIMGANIGTTLTAWIMSLGYNVDLSMVVFPSFFIGMLLIYSRKQRNVGDLLFGLAFMLLSLVMLSTTGKEMNLGDNEAVVAYFASFDTGSYLTILSFLFIGTLITCVVQSSAAVMALTILLCSSGVLPIQLGIALVMGENIGTTATANIAALGANTQARRAALAHLVFNVIGVVWVLILFYPFTDLVCQLAGYDPAAGGQVERLSVVLAMFHTCFNVTNTLLLLGFVPQLERLVCRLLPMKDEQHEEEPVLRYIQSSLVQTPEISVLQAQRETSHFAQRVQDMFADVRHLLVEKEHGHFFELFNKIEQQEDHADRTEAAIAQYMEQLGDDHLSDGTKRKVAVILREIGELESIADACYNMARTLRRFTLKHADGTMPSSLLTPWQMQQLTVMMQHVDDALTQMNRVLAGKRDRQNVSLTFRLENDINALRVRLKSDNIRAINEHQYDYNLGTVFMDLVLECEKLGDYVVNVVQARAAN
ncbi:MAG: Na/Pi cotransporter family protein [Bacteroidaceae bacterium]|nr:Na/Pi cotransporter family protein [Bacteroidaceae bacterium]